MERRDLLSGLFLLLISLVVSIMAFRLGLGTGGNPGAGFAAFGIALILGFLSLGLIIQALIKGFRQAKPAPELPEIKLRKPAFILLVLAGYGVFFNVLGFPLATFLLMMLLVWVFGRQKPTLALTVSILTTVSAYALFIVAFELPLPRGIVGVLIGR
jgi:hypothetical protein